MLTLDACVGLERMEVAGIGGERARRRRSEARMLAAISASPARFLVRGGRGGCGEGDGSIAWSQEAPVVTNRRRRHRHRGGPHGGKARFGSIRKKGEGKEMRAGERRGGAPYRPGPQQHGAARCGGGGMAPVPWPPLWRRKKEVRENPPSLI